MNMDSSILNQFIGVRMSVARRSAGITVAASAQHLGILVQEYVALEEGRSRTSPSQISSLARLFNVEIRFFFSDSRPDDLGQDDRTAVSLQNQIAASRMRGGLSALMHANTGCAKAA